MDGPVSPGKRGARDRHERGLRCGGRKSCDGRARPMRTAKSCGPDAPVLASSFVDVSAKRRWQKAGRRGEHAISRKTIVQGRPDALRFTCMLVCAFFCAHCTRDRGCSAHPVFPAPSACLEGQGPCKPRAHRAARRWSRVCIFQLPIASQAFDANCRRQITMTTAAVVANNTHGLTNQPR